MVKKVIAWWDSTGTYAEETDRSGLVMFWTDDQKVAVFEDSEDYTGHGCQCHSILNIFDTLEEALVLGLTEEEAQQLNLSEKRSKALAKEELLRQDAAVCYAFFFSERHNRALGVACWDQRNEWYDVMWFSKEKLPKGLHPFLRLMKDTIDSWIDSETLPYQERKMKPYEDEWWDLVSKLLNHDIQLSDVQKVTAFENEYTRGRSQ